MKSCCNFYQMVVLTFLTLMLTANSLQAQTQPNCDVSKCSPKDKLECAKKCGIDVSMASLTDFMFDEERTESKKCNPPTCQKRTAVVAKLVSREIKSAKVYSNSLESETLVNTKPKQCCSIKCSKEKTSL